MIYIIPESMKQKGVRMIKNLRNTGYSPFTGDTLFVRSAGYCEQIDGPQETPRMIDFGEFFWCTAGSAVFTIGKHRYILHPGEVFFYPPGSLMDFRAGKNGWAHYFVTIGGDAFKTMLPALGIKPGKKQCGRPPEDLFRQLIAGLKKPLPEQRIPALSLAMQIIFQIATSSIQHKQQETAAEKAKNIIEQKFTDPDFNIGKLAWHLAVHRVTLCREFKKFYSITPQEFLSSCRLHLAIKLLQENQMTIKEIAFSCGFSSQEYFSTVFSKKFGHPPSRL